MFGTDIEQIEHKRPSNPALEAVYLLSAAPYVVDCLVADIERKTYRRSYLIWTSSWFGPTFLAQGIRSDQYKFCLPQCVSELTDAVVLKNRLHNSEF